ncbi:MAG: pseudaminic acid synthase, partial [Thiotrichales bacterium SG8_50]
MSVYVIAEAGVNHNGDLAMACEMVDLAADAGVDAVKFQSFHAEGLVAQAAATLEYQRKATGYADQFAMLKKLEISEDGFQELFEKCESVGIEFISTPFDFESLEMLLRLGVNRLKVSSGEITNWPFLKAIAGSGLPVILSTGMADLNEVRQAVDLLVRERPEIAASKELSLLHCTSAYP